jgi:O-antigen/teichoic acid export membrane protein
MTASYLITEASTAAPHTSAQNAGGTGYLANVATVLGGQFACALFALAIEICYARLIGPAGRGQISLCMIVIGIGVVMASLGGETPIAVWGANRKNRIADWLPAVYFWGFLGSTAVDSLWALVYWRWHPSSLHGITGSLAMLVLLAVPATIFLDYILAFLSGMELFRQRAGLILASQIMKFVATIVLVLAVGRTAEMAIAGNLMGLACAAILGVILMKQGTRSPWSINAAQQNLWPALSLGVRGQFGTLATLVSYRLDVFVVNYFLGPAQVGLYALGVVISESLWQVPNAAALALLPRTARTLDQKSTEFTCAVLRQVCLIACLLGLLLALSAPFLIPWIFGSRFAPSVQVIWWILPGTLALSLSKVMSADITARGKPEFNSYVAIMGGIATVVLDFAFIPRMGIQGAALASSIAYLLEGIVLGFVLRRQLGISWRSMLLPSGGEFAAYSGLWQALRSRLGS